MDFYISHGARKLFGVFYHDGDKIPGAEFKRQPGLLEQLMAKGAVTECDDMSLSEATEFNAKAKKQEEKADAIPKLQAMEWREARDAVMNIKSAETLFTLQRQEKKRESGARKSVLRAIDSQLQLYG